MNSENTPLAEHLPSAEELAVLKERWEHGELMARVGYLLHFVSRNRDEILRRTGSVTDKSQLVRTIQVLIVENGSVHLPSELKDQINEIRSEIWYRGEEGPHEPKEIQQEWTLHHASAWRRWRLKEYIFVADRCAAQLASRITQHQTAGSSY